MTAIRPSFQNITRAGKRLVTIPLRSRARPVQSRNEKVRILHRRKGK